MNVSQCAAAVHRAGMTDEEFWQDVADDLQPWIGACPDADDSGLDDSVAATRSPCPECGAPGACAWDADGRPLIHVSGDDE